jgi:hypothetical protein
MVTGYSEDLATLRVADAIGFDDRPRYRCLAPKVRMLDPCRWAVMMFRGIKQKSEVRGTGTRCHSC